MTARKPFVYVLNIVSGQVIALEGHENPVAGAAFSPGGQQIVTVSNDGSLRLWDAQSGALLDVLNAHTSPILYVAFSEDGRHIVTASADGTARLWPAFVSTQELIDFAKSELPRCMTTEQRTQKFALGDMPRAWCKRLHKWPNASGG